MRHTGLGRGAVSVSGLPFGAAGIGDLHTPGRVRPEDCGQLRAEGLLSEGSLTGRAPGACGTLDACRKYPKSKR